MTERNTGPRVQHSNVTRHRCRWCQTEYVITEGDGHQCEPEMARQDTYPRIQHSNVTRHRCQWCQTEYEITGSNGCPVGSHQCNVEDRYLWKLSQRATATLRDIGVPIPEKIETYDRRLFILDADMGGDPDFLGLSNHPTARETLLGILVDASGEPRADTSPETSVEDGGNRPHDRHTGDDRVPSGPFKGHRYRFLRRQDIESVVIDNRANYLTLKKAL